MCTVTKRRKYARRSKVNFASKINAAKQSAFDEDDLDKVIFLSSLTNECFEKTSKQEAEDFETWLFADND